MCKQEEKVFIILLNWNNAEDTIDCLNSLADLTYGNIQVIVLDNASTDNSAERIHVYLENKSVTSSDNNLFPYLDAFGDQEKTGIQEALSMPLNETSRFLYPAILIRNSVNYGFARAHNIVMTLIDDIGNYGYIWVLNNDTTVFPDTLTALIREAELSSSTGLVGSIIRFFERTDMVQAVGGGSFYPYFGTSRLFAKNMYLSDMDQLVQKNDIKTLDYIMGASLLIKKEVISTVGVFCEDYFVYTEDLDYCHRARQKGWQLSVALDSHLLHKESSSTKDKKELYYYLLARNNLLFIKKYFPLYTFISASILLPLIIISWTRKPKNIFYGLKGIMHCILNKHIKQ